jgi:hypothetical protein
MPSPGLECFLQGRNTFDRVGIPLYMVGMLSRGLECFLECGSAFWSVGKLSRLLACFLEGWNAFDGVGIPLYRVGMLSRELEYLCTELECFRPSWNTFLHGFNAV